MSESIRSIDTRGLACPQPVVAAKKALEEGGFDILEIVVDGPSARENVARFAARAGHAVEGIEDAGAASTIRIRRKAEAGTAEAAQGGKAASSDPSEAASVSANASRARTVFVSSDAIGSGDAELGALLMRGFIATLLEATPLPERIILMNAGVRLAVEGSASLSSLGKLAELGVEILACGTCLDFYGIKDKLAVGRVSNMFEISLFLLEGPTLSM